MKIEKSWFFVLENITDDTLEILDGIHVCVFDGFSTVKKIFIWNDVKFHYFSYFSDGESITKHFQILWEKSDVMIRSFHYSRGNQMKFQFIWELASSQSKLDMHLTSIVWENGNIDIDGVVQINENIAQVEWYLREQNIFLWDSWKIRGIPTLLVWSNDVKASHGCNIEKISDDKLFYLRSRGLEKNLAMRVMLESYIRNTFEHLEHVDSNFYHQLVEKILEKVQ